MTDSLHVSRYIHVGSTGGTERYLLDLATALREAGDRVRIAWVGGIRQQQKEFIDKHGFQIVPFEAPESYVDVPAPAQAEWFRAWLRNNPPEVIHFHTFSLSEAAMADVAWNLGIPYVFVYHSPAWSCRRGDLLRWGHTICDGDVRPWRCSACLMQQRLGWPVGPSWAATACLAPFGLFGRFVGGKLHRRTAYLTDTARFRNALRAFLGHAAKTIACAEWSIPILERNGAVPERILNSPQGVAMDVVKAMTGSASGGGEASGNKARHSLFTVGYVGRVIPVKGVHLLVEAFAKTPYPSARLQVFGCGETESEAPYQRRLKILAGSDSRIEFFGKMTFQKMLEAYREMDLLAIPSIGLETGPLTLLEALAMGVSTWGSDRIGQIATLRQYGRVITPNTVPVWQTVLAEAFAQHRDGGWRKPDAPPLVRTMADVAVEMRLLYAECVSSSRQSAVKRAPVTSRTTGGRRDR